MASLLQGLVVIMLIHLAYIMLSRHTLYARSGIRGISRRNELTNLYCDAVYSGKQCFFIFRDLNPRDFSRLAVINTADGYF